MGTDEWLYWTSDTTLAKESDSAADFARRKLMPLTAVLQTVEDGQEIVPGIQAFSAPGHTVGQMDANPKQTMRTRPKMFRWAVDHDALVLAEEKDRLVNRRKFYATLQGGEE